MQHEKGEMSTDCNRRIPCQFSAQGDRHEPSSSAKAPVGIYPRPALDATLPTQPTAYRGPRDRQALEDRLDGSLPGPWPGQYLRRKQQIRNRQKRLRLSSGTECDSPRNPGTPLLRWMFFLTAPRKPW